LEQFIRPSRNAVIGAIARSLLAALERFEAEGFASARTEWEAMDAHAGRRRPRRRRGPASHHPRGRGGDPQRPHHLDGARLILGIDAGNSRVKWGWHDGQRWTSVASVSLIEFAASSDHVNPFSVTHDDPERIVISNVAGEGAHQLLVNWTSIFDAEPLWLRAEAERCGVHNRY